jgi:tetratricopeptide (TPR) repeat protein
MRLFVAVAVVMMLALPGLVHAEIKTITHTVQQPFGGSQSPDDARTAGIARAKREALEQFGTYIESTTIVKDSQVDSDEILALTAGVTKAEVLKQKNYTDGDGFGLEITVKVELDTAVLDQSLKRLLQDRNHLKDLKAARVREKQLLSRIAELEKQNQQKGKSAKQTAQLKKEFQKTRDGLTAVEWLDKAMALWDGKKFKNSIKAVEYLSLAISLDPNMYVLYLGRGFAYVELKQYQQAITDYDQAIKFEPNSKETYNNRGMAYKGLKQYQHAMSDFNKAIQLDPNFAMAYYNRGIIYESIEDIGSALSDYSKSIRLNPNLAQAYTSRGVIYFKFFDDGIENAIADFDDAIRIDSNYIPAYLIRGIIYIDVLKQKEKGCTDFKKACSLGMCNGYETAHKAGDCI